MYFSNSKQTKIGKVVDTVCMEFRIFYKFEFFLLRVRLWLAKKL